MKIKYLAEFLTKSNPTVGKPEFVNKKQKQLLQVDYFNFEYEKPFFTNNEAIQKFLNKIYKKSRIKFDQQII